MQTTNKTRRSMLKTAARDMVLDNLIDQGISVQRFSDKEASVLYDEIMAAPAELDKLAEAATPEVLVEEDPRDVVLAKAAEATMLGKLTAQAYAASGIHIFSIFEAGSSVRSS